MTRIGYYEGPGQGWLFRKNLLDKIRGKPDFYDKLNPYTEGFLNDHFEELEGNK